MATPAPEMKPTDGRDVEDKRNPKTGQFMKGYKGGRKHRIDLLSLCDRKAREEGIEFEDMVWLVVKALIRTAVDKNDFTVQKYIIDRFTKQDGQTPPDPKLSINLLAGPPRPGDMADYLEQLDAIETPQLLTVETPAQEVAEEIADLLGE